MVKLNDESQSLIMEHIDFLQLILMKTGGQIIYSGILGHHSSKLIEYFEVCS